MRATRAVTVAVTMLTLSCSRERPEVLILADTFISGAPPTWQTSGRLTRIGVRHIELHAFIVQRRLVHKDEYATCVEARACAALGPDRFAENPYSLHHKKPELFTTFDNAQAYCRWKGMRLVSQDEFERLARGTDGWASVCHKEPYRGCRENVVSRDGVRQLAWDQWIDRRDATFPLGATMGSSGYGAVVDNDSGTQTPFAEWPFRCARDAPASLNRR